MPTQLREKGEGCEGGVAIHSGGLRRIEMGNLCPPLWLTSF